MTTGYKGPAFTLQCLDTEKKVIWEQVILFEDLDVNEDGTWNLTLCTKKKDKEEVLAEVSTGPKRVAEI